MSALSIVLAWCSFSSGWTDASRSSPATGRNPRGIRFEDEAARSGVHFVVDNCETPNRYQIEPMIAGVGLFDYDNDGRLDIYLCNGAQIPELEKTSARFSNRLFHNEGGLRFRDVTDRAGVGGAGYSMGVAAGDYDNDGWADLYVTGVNRNTLYRNRGDGTFEDVTLKARVGGILEGQGKAWSVGAGWLDYDNDGDLDLFVVNYCVWSLEKDPYCGAPVSGHRTYCHPDMFAPLPNFLYRNNGDGTFADVSLTAGISQHPGKGMGVCFADYDRDGFLDIFVSNDTVRNFLFRNRGDGSFEERGLEAGVAYSQEGIAVSGMGSDFGDVDDDGLPDIFMTALPNETFPLFRNRGDGMFSDQTYASGLGLQSLVGGGWSTGMVDFDNDGRLDLFVAGGHVQTNAEVYSGRPSKQSNLLFHNLGQGRFEEISVLCGPAFRQLGLHRGAAFGDLDNDGRIDAVVTRLNEAVELLHNLTTAPGRWLAVELEGVAANRQGLGAEVILHLESGRRLLRQASAAVGYGGSSDRRVHFGLGDEDRVRRLEVRWPGGQRQSLDSLPIDRLVRVRQPSRLRTATETYGASPKAR